MKQQMAKAQEVHGATIESIRQYAENTTMPLWPHSAVPFHILWTTMVVRSISSRVRIRHCIGKSLFDLIPAGHEAIRSPNLILIVDVSSEFTPPSAYKEIGMLKNLPASQRSVCLVYFRDEYAVSIATTPQYRRQARKSIDGILVPHLKEGGFECMICFSDRLVIDGPEPAKRLVQCPHASCTAVYCQKCIEESLDSKCVQCKVRMNFSIKFDGVISVRPATDQDPEFWDAVRSQQQAAARYYK